MTQAAPSNFDFLTEWPQLLSEAKRAEAAAHTDPRVSAFYVRRVLEHWVNWLYDFDPAFHRPVGSNIHALLNAPSFAANVPAGVAQTADLLRLYGNLGVHEGPAPSTENALQGLRLLWDMLVWFAGQYRHEKEQALPTAFHDEWVVAQSGGGQLTAAQFAALEAREAAADERERELARREAALESAQAVRAQQQAQVVADKAANVAAQPVPMPSSLSEAQTRRLYIDLMLAEAGWDVSAPNVREFKVSGLRNTASGKGSVDYVLWGADGLPLAVVEAKKATEDVEKGRAQAKDYAQALEAQYGRRPVVFYSNGFKTYLWDDARQYPPRQVHGFYNRDQLEALIARRTGAKALATVPVDTSIAGRPYQQEAIQAVADRFTALHREALVVMATGTGKTRVAVALVKLMMQAGWIRRVLFLADRRELVKQAVGAFNAYYPASNPVNALKHPEQVPYAQVVVSTYQTMMGLIDGKTEDGKPKKVQLTPGAFDLVIIDEAHRSVYNEYGALLEYFDALLLGLTATPKDEVDKNTYSLFKLREGQPTFAYDLADAVAQGYLVDGQRVPVTTLFSRQGVKYADLSDEEKDRWDAEDWGEDREEISASELNTKFLNVDTTLKVLHELMTKGLMQTSGDYPGKTIIFASGHKHAEHIYQVLTDHYPQFSEFAQVITRRAFNSDLAAENAVDAFRKPDGNPFIAISVDMLDTGIDVPEVVNLVMVKEVRSKTKFLQMLGRGTRLSPNLHGAGKDKDHFRVFDFGGNYEYFDQHPQGVASKTQPSVMAQGFKLRLDLLLALQDKPGEDSVALRQKTADDLHAWVSSLPQQNFLVRPHLETVKPLLDRAAWDSLTAATAERLRRDVAGLPFDLPQEKEQVRRFDNAVLSAQLAQVMGQSTATVAARLGQLAQAIGEKTTIAQVQQNANLLAQLQTPEFWQETNPTQLEKVRERLRTLSVLVEREIFDPIVVDFQDHLLVTETPPPPPAMNMAAYKAGVSGFVRAHIEQPEIQKIRNGQPLNLQELRRLEDFFFSAQGAGSRETFEEAYGSDEHLGSFVRRIVGLERSVAQKAFEAYSAGKSLDRRQLQYIQFLIDAFDRGGVINPDALYDAPFTNLSDTGPEGVFGADTPLIWDIVERLSTTIKA